MQRRDYADFVFRLEYDGASEGFTARVLDSPAGEGHGRFELAISAECCLRSWVAQAAAVLDGRRLAPVARRQVPADLSQVGEALFQALFPPAVRRLWERSVGLVAPGWLRLQVRMDLRQPALAPLLALPWELMQDPETGGRWGLSRRSPVVRYVETSQSRSSIPLPSRLRVLMVGSQPRDAPALQLEREQRLVKRALGRNDGVTLLPPVEARLGPVREAVLETGCHVLHFMGHGDFRPGAGEGCLVFEDSRGRADPVSGKELATALGDLESLRLVVLNACHGGAIRGGTGRDPFAGVASSLVHAGLPAVVAMQLPISDASAIAFSRRFYGRLAAGDAIEIAVVEGRQAIHGAEHRSMEWAIPALFSRLGGGQLFATSNCGGGRSATEPKAEPRAPTDEEHALDRGRRLLEAASASRVPDDLLATACGKLLAGEHRLRIEKMLIEALEDSSDPATAGAAARILALVERWTPDIAEALASSRPHDAAPWPIEAALYRVVAHDPDLLPHARTSLRRTLLRRPDLARRFLDDRAWRRLGLLVYGGLGEAGAIDCERFYHESPELSREILEALEDHRDAASLVAPLRRLVAQGTATARRDAALALASLGERPAGLVLIAELRPMLQRLRAMLRAAPITLRPFGLDLARRLEGLDSARRDEIVGDLLALVPPQPSEPAALLAVAEALPPEQRMPWLVELWRRLLSASHPRPVYNLAVVLDTAGDTLSNPPWLLASSLARAVLGADAVRARAQYAEPCPDAVPCPDAELCLALDAVAGLPRLFDFLRGWVLVRLRPALAAAGLLPEALILASGLSDRLEARTETVRRLVEPEACRDWLTHPRPASMLLDMAQSLVDPLLRFRAYRRLAVGWARTRERLLIDRLGVDSILLAPASAAVLQIDDSDQRAWARKELERMVAAEYDVCRSAGGPDVCRHAIGRGRRLLAAGVDEVGHPVSVLVGLALVEDLLLSDSDSNAAESVQQPQKGLPRPTTHRPGMGRPVSRLGVSVVRRLARDWLDLRESEPASAIAARWRLESIEHDDTEALREWAAVLSAGDRQRAAEAEAILGTIHGLRGHAWPVVSEILQDGCSRARRALLRSVGFLLARRRVPREVWPELDSALRSLRHDRALVVEGIVLDGPAALVSAGGAVRQALAEDTVDGPGVAVAERAYERYRLPWPAILEQSADDLRRTLADAGAERLVTARSRAEVAAAADRLVSEPPVFEVLLEWASHHLRRDVQHGGPEDYLTADLLCVLAHAAEQLGDFYRRKAETLPLWERQLCEAARLCDWYPARRAALVLLARSRQKTTRVLAAMRAGLQDVPDVARAALEGLAHWGSIEPGGVPEHLIEHYSRWLYETQGLDGALAVRAR